jgi:hypothetical protein
VAADNAAAGRWETNHGGEYTAFGVGGSVTGRRGDCLVGGTLVDTPSGKKQIKDVEVGEYVLSYSGVHSCAVYRRVTAVARREATELFRVHSSLGGVVEATGNHRIYCGTVWKESSTITQGDVLLCVLPEAVQSDSVRTSEEGQDKSSVPTSMRIQLRGTDDQRKSGHEAGADLQQLQDRDVGCPAWSKGLLGQVQVGDCRKARIRIEEGADPELRCVQDDLQASKQKLRVEMLLNGVQEQDALGDYAGHEQPNMEGRRDHCSTAGWTAKGIQAGSKE